MLKPAMNHDDIVSCLLLPVLNLTNHINEATPRVRGTNIRPSCEMVLTHNARCTFLQCITKIPLFKLDCCNNIFSFIIFNWNLHASRRLTSSSEGGDSLVSSFLIETYMFRDASLLKKMQVYLLSLWSHHLYCWVSPDVIVAMLVPFNKTISMISFF